ncbi:hypothetical protein ABB29_07535 [Pseudoxanthomonas dokdonensis]|uniref:Uncharacterized protein n=2 Tax=Pseudoxanthomonas dokdonensis TaxID=344882 RepID=A0A0R0CUQ8_9GAMM|nr:hypothetical protein ABB29_07535 [Pseudoxanthomonas dokdonensis]
MERIRFRRLAVYFLSFGLALPALTGTAAAASHDDTYFVRQEVGPVDGPALITQQMLMPVTLEADGKGSRMRASTVWFELDAGAGQHGSSYKLDARYADDAAVAAFLASGIETRVDGKGRVVSVGAADPQALEAVARHRPGVRDALARIGDAVGLRPFVLPRRLHVGQRLHEKQQVPGIGELAWTMQVMAVGAEQVELEMQATASEGTSLAGYQILRRDSGMPVEAWLQMSLPDGLVPGHSEPMQLRMRVISQHHAKTLNAVQQDAETWKRYVNNLHELAASPEFRGEVVPTDELKDLDGNLERELILPQRSEAELERFRNGLVFALDGTGGTPRPEIRLGGQYDVSLPGEWPKMLRMRLKRARLLDANGEQLPGVKTVANRLFENMAAAEWELKERDEEFPFRLPPALPAAALEGLAAITLELELGEYVLQDRTVVANGKQAGSSSPVLDWSTHWVELRQPEPTGAELWVIAPMDKRGLPVRHGVIEYDDKLLRPESENMRWPLYSSQEHDWRYRVLTAEPVGAVELRRYTLRWRPTTWTFRNGKDMLDGGALIGVRLAAEPTGLPSSTVSGQALLDAFGTLVDKTDSGVRIPLHGDLQDVAVRFCEVGASSLANVPAVGWDKRSREDIFWSPDHEDWVGWSISRFALGDQPVTARANCPERIEPAVEQLHRGSCFQDLGNGYVGVAAACKADVDRAREQEMLVARDAQGQRLAELPGPSEEENEERLRFWGPVDTIEYLRVDASTVHRDLQLPTAEH